MRPERPSEVSSGFRNWGVIDCKLTLNEVGKLVREDHFFDRSKVNEYDAEEKLVAINNFCKGDLSETSKVAQVAQVDSLPFHWLISPNPDYKFEKEE